ncbi:MAG TPA: WD40 repeat domain-containing protein, partial [Herpetosiphonaceae bacterium]|nr:WD40 repeat domain-containing protein [Herpetosiphonaceae bacterium]
GSVTLDGAALPPDQESAQRRRWPAAAGSTLQAEPDSAGNHWNWSVWFRPEPADRLNARVLGARLDLWRAGEATRFSLDAGGAIKHWAITEDQRLAAISLATPGVTIWDIADQRQVKRLPDPPAPIAVLRFSPDGSRLLGLSYDYPQKLVLWDVEAGTLLRASTEVSTTGPLMFSRDQSLIILPYTTSNETTIELRRASDGALLKTLSAEPSKIAWFELSADGTRLIASGTDGTLGIWGLDP